MLRPRSMNAAVALALLMALGVGACGSTSTPTSTRAGVSAAATVGSPAASAGQCAGAGTRHFQKSRLVADLGLASGAFHRYLYRPYQAGTFRRGEPAQGASARKAALIKAAAAGAAIATLMKNAADNAQADPTLCRYVPSMLTISTAVRGLAGQPGGMVAAGGFAHSEALFAKLKSAVGFTDSGAPLPGLG